VPQYKVQVKLFAQLIKSQRPYRYYGLEMHQLLILLNRGINNVWYSRPNHKTSQGEFTAKKRRK